MRLLCRARGNSDADHSGEPRIHKPSLLGASARLQASASVAQIGGPGLGGLLVQLLSAPIALVIDGVSLLMLAVSPRLISIPGPTLAGRKDSTIRQNRDGVAVVLDGRLLRGLVGTSAIYNLYPQWIITLFAVRDLGMSAGTIGIVASSGGAPSFPHRGGTQ